MHRICEALHAMVQPALPTIPENQSMDSMDSMVLGAFGHGGGEVHAAWESQSSSNAGNTSIETPRGFPGLSR